MTSGRTIGFVSLPFLVRQPVHQSHSKGVRQILRKPALGTAVKNCTVRLCALKRSKIIGVGVRRGVFATPFSGSSASLNSANVRKSLGKPRLNVPAARLSHSCLTETKCETEPMTLVCVGACLAGCLTRKPVRHLAARPCILPQGFTPRPDKMSQTKGFT